MARAIATCVTRGTAHQNASERALGTPAPLASNTVPDRIFGAATPPGASLNTRAELACGFSEGGWGRLGTCNIFIVGKGRSKVELERILQLKKKLTCGPVVAEMLLEGCKVRYRDLKSMRKC
jgi:hypothetical protein